MFAALPPSSGARQPLPPPPSGAYCAFLAALPHRRTRQGRAGPMGASTGKPPKIRRSRRSHARAYRPHARAAWPSVGPISLRQAPPAPTLACQACECASSALQAAHAIDRFTTDAAGCVHAKQPTLTAGTGCQRPSAARRRFSAPLGCSLACPASARGGAGRGTAGMRRR